MSIILWAIPFFILLILIELWVDNRRGTGYYRLNDSVASLNAGILSRVMQIVKRLIPIAIYAQVQSQWALFDWPDVWWTGLIAFVLYDFCYYWNHRIGHERNLFWASHVVHHSSEEYNLTTALRQTSGSVLGWIFYLPLAVLGFDVWLFISVAALNLVYQFWVHSRHIGYLGWYEQIFVTPSNHRVHHAINDCYIDRNYGGVFILWDRLFGTFQAERDDEPCVYGIRKPLHSWNPIWTNWHTYHQLLKDSWHTRRWRDKLGIWLARTGWRPEDVRQSQPLPEFSMQRFKKFEIPVSRGIQVYALLHLALIIVALGAFMAFVGQLPTAEIVVYALAITLSCLSLGWLLEGRQIALAIEQLRLLLVIALTLAMSWSALWTGIIATLLVLSLVAIQVLHQPVTMPAKSHLTTTAEA